MVKTFAQFVEQKNIAYTAIVLNPESHGRLLAAFPPPPGWEAIAHHMTINMGELKDELNDPAILGQPAKMTVTHVGRDERVSAVAVDTPINSQNEIKHITVAVNRAGGGKPFHSNKIQEWTPVESMVLSGVVQEVSR
jgi:hypothetical protein